ncbi:DUF6510 family protein [Microbacterium hominis]|uniref:Uncharacterized protein n=1 Tax=Microbacterium hominis TaxID=162426 RepID=A0A7D4QCS6_9MICO|nr:DUF6510 family protein [Microbacterium hominis]QKJ19537.1 hypothetical protein HQM25_09290 [Microbacterium hominis]
MREEIARAVVDGNALAGMLSGMFGDDATMLIGVCGGCGAHAPLAETVVELDDDAAIVRCRACTHTLFVVLRPSEPVRLRFGMLRELHWA